MSTATEERTDGYKQLQREAEIAERKLIDAQGRRDSLIRRYDALIRLKQDKLYAIQQELARLDND